MWRHVLVKLHSSTLNENICINIQPENTDYLVDTKSAQAFSCLKIKTFLLTFSNDVTEWQ